MPQEAVEIARRGLNAWNRQDSEAVLKLFSSDARLDASDRVLNPEVYVGLEGVMRFRDEISETWERFQLEIEEVFEAGDSIVVFIRSLGRGRSSGAEVNVESAWLVTVEGQEITSLRLYRDRAEALEAVGLMGG